MIINVVPRKFVKMFSANDSFFLRNNFISIGEVEGYANSAQNNGVGVVFFVQKALLETDVVSKIPSEYFPLKSKNGRK